MQHRKYIRGKLSHSDPEVRTEAAHILGRQQDRGALPRLIFRLGDSNADVRIAATEAVVQIGDPHAIPALVPLLDDPFPTVQEAAVAALRKLEGPEAVPFLVEALKNGNNAPRRYAAEALGRIEDLRAVSALRLALRDSDVWVQFRSAESLRKLKPADVEAGLELMYLLKYGSEGIREAANKALEPPEPVVGTPQLRWTVLPHGWWRDSEIVARVIASAGGASEGKLLLERLIFIDSLKPSERYNSDTSFGTRMYSVFVFNQHVVAECPSWGNAVYVIKGTHDWRELLQHTKRQVLTVAGDRAKRLVHKGAWQARLASILATQD